MLRSFVELKSGDTVIQNGANSAVGRYVIQIAASMGVNTVNIVRPRGDEQETAALTAELKGLGAAVVTTPDALKADLAHAGLAAPKLALDCVGGDVGLATAKALTCVGRGVALRAGGARVAACAALEPTPLHPAMRGCAAGTAGRW